MVLEIMMMMVIVGDRNNKKNNNDDNNNYGNNNIYTEQGDTMSQMSKKQLSSSTFETLGIEIFQVCFTLGDGVKCRIE